MDFDRHCEYMTDLQLNLYNRLSGPRTDIVQSSRTRMIEAHLKPVQTRPGPVLDSSRSIGKTWARPLLLLPEFSRFFGPIETGHTECKL